MNLTDKTAARIAKQAPEKNNVITWDDKLTGFGLKVTPNAHVSWILNYHLHGKERRITLGRFPEMTASEARAKGEDYRTDIRKGEDPLKTKQDKQHSPTLNHALHAYLNDPETLQLRPNTLSSYKGIAKHHLGYSEDKPKGLAAQQLKAITRADIVALHVKMKGRPYQANRMLALLSTVYTFALLEDRAWVEKNPVIGINRHPEEKRKRYLKPAEVERFYQALDGYIIKHQGTYHEQNAIDSVCALRLLLLTGSRLNEVLGADWKEFDLESGIWRKPANRMKAGEESEIPLSQTALDVLLSMQPQATGPLFIGRNGQKPRVSLKRPWDYAIQNAKLTNIRKHDLRHSFASFAISNGVPLAVISGLLAHKQASTTQRYAHLLSDSLRQGADAVGKVLQFEPRRAS